MFSCAHFSLRETSLSAQNEVRRLREELSKYKSESAQSVDRTVELDAKWRQEASEKEVMVWKNTNEDGMLQSLRSQLADLRSQLAQVREQKQRAQEEVLELQVNEHFEKKSFALFLKESS